MTPSVFLFKDFRKFLLELLESPHAERGIQARWAEASGCQPAYMSHVLKNRAELSLEQAEALANYLRLDAKSKEYFLTLVQLSRAGTSSLKSYLKGKLEVLKKDYDNLKQRVNIESKMNLEDQVIYYSRWQYTAVHMAVMLTEATSASKIAQRLTLPLAEVEEALDVLTRLEFIKKTETGWNVEKTTVHLENSSPLVKTLHSQWRLKSIDAITPTKNNQDLRYSGCLALSKEDLDYLKEFMTSAIQKSIARVIESPVETLAVLNVDLFEI